MLRLVRVLSFGILMLSMVGCATCRRCAGSSTSIRENNNNDEQQLALADALEQLERDKQEREDLLLQSIVDATNRQNQGLNAVGLNNPFFLGNGVNPGLRPPGFDSTQPGIGLQRNTASEPIPAPPRPGIPPEATVPRPDSTPEPRTPSQPFRPAPLSRHRA